MFSDNVRVPEKWTISHKKMLAEHEEDKELIALDKLLLWVKETGLTTEAASKSVFDNLNAYRYLRCLFPILPEDQTGKKLFQLNLHFLVMGYVIDDTIEKYSEKEMRELIDGYNFLQNQVSKTFPKLPSISKVWKLLGEARNKFSRSAIVTVVDYVNRTTMILLEGEICEESVLNYRNRLSNAIAVYFNAILSKTKTGCKISENEMLYRRCFDALSIAVYMSTEVFSKTLVRNQMLPTSELYKFYLLSTLFCVVINDLYSYERDKLDDTDSVIKVWYAQNEVTDMKAATTKVSKILDRIIQQMYLFVKEGKSCHPELSEWFERIAAMTVGWIYIHKYVVFRYVSSPFQIAVVEVKDEMIPDWLTEKDAYGETIVQNFLDGLEYPHQKDVLDSLYGCNRL